MRWGRWSGIICITGLRESNDSALLILFIGIRPKGYDAFSPIASPIQKAKKEILCYATRADVTEKLVKDGFVKREKSR